MIIWCGTLILRLEDFVSYSIPKIILHVKLTVNFIVDLYTSGKVLLQKNTCICLSAYHMFNDKLSEIMINSFAL